MPCRIEKFKMEHLDNFAPRKEQLADIKYLKAHLDHQKAWEVTNPIFTLFNSENIPILIYGMVNDMCGTYTAMFFAAEGSDKYIHSMVRCIYKYVEEFVGYDVRRFEVQIHATDRQSARAAKHFGMELIGIRRQACMDGEDQALYERLWRKG